jgi:hypothetical protein
MAGAKLIELLSLMRKRDQFVGRWHTLSQRFPRHFRKMQVDFEATSGQSV